MNSVCANEAERPDGLDVYEDAVLETCGGVLGTGLSPLPPMPLPSYRPVASGDWKFNIIRLPSAPGYFRGPQILPYPVAVLSRDGATWMSATPMEIESQMPHAAVSHGMVVICGLGLGLMAYAVAARRSVDRVVVVERDREVMELFRAYSDFDRWPQRNKIAIVIDDARAFRCPDVDFLYVDIWPRYRMDEMIPDMQAIHAQCPAPRCGYWGQELDMVAWAEARGVEAANFDIADVRDFSAEHGLPLIGPEIEGYAGFCRLAAKTYAGMSPLL